MGNCCSTRESSLEESKLLNNKNEKIDNLPTIKTRAYEKEKINIIDSKTSNIKSINEILMKAAMWIRSTNYSNPQFLYNIGHRKEKYFFLVQNKKQKQYIMTASPIHSQMADLFSSDSTKFSFIKLLKSIDNPYILPTIDAEFQYQKIEKNDNISLSPIFSNIQVEQQLILILFRPNISRGSLRDYIHHSKPTNIYEKKYTQTSGHPLPENKIAKFGREILEGLEYLSCQGYPFFLNVHTGNIIVDDGSVCRLTDYESDIIGLNPKLKNIFKELDEKNLNYNPICISFGCILYEMATGYELDSSLLDDIPKNMNSTIKNILENIFKPTEPISLKKLLENPFFSKIKLYSNWEPKKIEINNKTKKLLEIANNFINQTFQEIKESKNTKIYSKNLSSPINETKKKKKKLKSSKSQSIVINKKEDSTINNNIESVSSLPPPPPPTPISSSFTTTDNERKELLSSIESFKKNKLKKTITNDRSAPKI